MACKKCFLIFCLFLAVQVEVHSSSSGAGSGSDESLSVASSASSTASSRSENNVPAIPSMNRQNGAISHNLHSNHHLNSTSAGGGVAAASVGSNHAHGPGASQGAIMNNNNNNNDHDYEDIYLVREEVRNQSKALQSQQPQSNLLALSSTGNVATTNNTKVGRSRSRDSGSHSRSASASSNHSTDYVIQYGNVSSGRKALCCSFNCYYYSFLLFTISRISEWDRSRICCRARASTESRHSRTVSQPPTTTMRTRITNGRRATTGVTVSCRTIRMRVCVHPRTRRSVIRRRSGMAMPC